MPIEKVYTKDTISMFFEPTLINGKEAISIRKIFTFCEKNQDFLTQVIKAAMEDKLIEAKISIRFRDKLKAKLWFQEHGIPINGVNDK